MLDVDRRELRDLAERIARAIQILKAAEESHARIHVGGSAVRPPMEDATRKQIESYVIEPIVESATALAARLDDQRLRFVTSNVGHRSGRAAVMQYIVALGCLGAEIERLREDFEPTVAAAVEVAFQHLNRSLVVDADLRAKWLNAYNSGELACEKLGGVHLLAHQLWGFKTDAAGERSDLVLGQAPSQVGTIALRAAQGLVLTEWKKAFTGTTAEIDKLGKQARAQLMRYAGGSLVPLELNRTRYVVIVSRKHIVLPEDPKTNDGITFRHVNIVVEPSVPSASLAGAGDAS